MEVIRIKTPSHTCTVDITDLVFEKLREKSIQSGVCLVYTPHTTAGIIINEGADPDVMTDVLSALEKIAPWQGGYRHAEGNSAAHIKSILVGGSVQVIVDSGKLALGTWQRIFFMEFDGPRTRKIYIQFTGS